MCDWSNKKLYTWNDIILRLIIGMFGCFMFGIWMGVNIGRDQVKQSAVARGHMVTVFNKATKYVEFKWKDEITSNSVILGGKIEK